MTENIVNIESADKNNKSFGTGFVIHTDEKGIYILTCKHVLDDVKTPIVEEIQAKVIVSNDFIDMAVLYVNTLRKFSLPLQIDLCQSLDVEVIGFSHFNKNLNQKQHIQATLYQESVELHSTEDDSFYVARKIKAKEGYNFDRGNSGSPVICKESQKVIAMISNKQGNDIGYAIDISSLKEIWTEMPQQILVQKTISPNNKPSIEKENTSTIENTRISLSAQKYLLFSLLAIILAVGTYFYFGFNESRISKATRLERAGFEALIGRDFEKALNNFEKAEETYNGFHNVYEISHILRKNYNTLKRPNTQIRIVKLILIRAETSPRVLRRKLRQAFGVQRVH